jgi:rfaE bifunctional protein nucleotidyltransferase chain/domain
MKQLELIKSKILTPEKLITQLKVWEFKEQKVVFTNGCFDVLHHGHMVYLSQAKDLGNKLIIGLNTDFSVKRLKGNNRPINPEYSRAIMLAAFQFVDAVILFNDDTPNKLIKQVQPDILVKGGDYKKEDIVGADVVLKGGGDVVTIDFVEGYSSSAIINRMKK